MSAVGSLDAAVASSSHEDVLTALPHFLLENILLKLGPGDIVNCGCVSTRLRDVALSEALWSRLAYKLWGEVTSPRRWLVESALGHFELGRGKLDYPGTYRRATWPYMEGRR